MLRIILYKVQSLTPLAWLYTDVSDGTFHVWGAVVRSRQLTYMHNTWNHIVNLGYTGRPSMRSCLRPREEA